MKDIPGLVLVWMLFMMALIGMFLGHLVAQSNTKKEAIRAGVAYYTNDASGVAQFKWKECK
jgi:hypothetical protein